MIRKLLSIPLMALLGAIGGFCLLEGLSSLVLFVDASRAYRPPPLNEERYVEYDPELGWIGRKNAAIPDMYGPGGFLHTNAQGFRGSANVLPDAPRNKKRVICSGDSFTFGYGVSDDQTWCHQLELLEPRLETVNMGQGGYSLSQAYLWYERDGDRLEHAVHIFAFIVSDFQRMQDTVFCGHGKPQLEIAHGELVTRNVPVPRRFAFWPLLRRRFQIATIGLRASQLLQHVRRRGGDAATLHASTLQFDKGTWQVAAKIFEQLTAMNRQRQSALVLAFLPMEADYLYGDSDPWRDHVRREADRLGIDYVDLVTPFRELPLHAARELIQQADQPGAGHYTAAGNRWVAEHIHRRLAQLPVFDARSTRASPSS